METDALLSLEGAITDAPQVTMRNSLFLQRSRQRVAAEHACRTYLVRTLRRSSARSLVRILHRRASLRITMHVSVPHERSAPTLSDTVSTVGHV